MILNKKIPDSVWRIIFLLTFYKNHLNDFYVSVSENAVNRRVNQNAN